MDMKPIKIISPKGCNDYSLVIESGNQSRRDDIKISPLRDLWVFGIFHFYNLIIPSGFKMQLL